MMSRKARYGYFQGDGFQAVRLPYGRGRLAMYVFLPGPDSSLEEFCRKLDETRWQEWLPKFGSQQILLRLPRFTAEYDVKLNDALTALEMGIAFDPDKADFSAMGGELWIGKVRHKAFLRVHEKGTEAAASTAVQMEMAEQQLPGRTTMIVNRPFVCAIMDHNTDAILFLGAIVDPRE